MKSFAQIDADTNGRYLQLLSAVAKLSVLFSDSAVPYINYRAVENIFCRCFSAKNLSRSDTAFDADYRSVGVGLKTFLAPQRWSLEKVAEFNSLSATLRELSGKELAIALAGYRNERILLAKRLYNLKDSLYHIVARREHALLLFETDYDFIQADAIRVTRKTASSLQFNDGSNYYSYNYSKSTLFRDFEIPASAHQLSVEIIGNPYDVLLDAFGDTKNGQVAKSESKKEFVILPLYSTGSKERRIPERSGLNQWNAGGRKRSYGEVYIPIPKEIHKQFPLFFPNRDTPFELRVPSGEVLHAKICQEGGKALMTNPNNALSDWLLRKVLGLEEGMLATIGHLDALGFDSVIIAKESEHIFEIDIAKDIHYSQFVNGH